jgi:hypothetical protein
MSFVLGMNGKLYRNTATWGSPVWDEVPNVKDVDDGSDFDTWEATNRASGGVKSFLPTLQNWSLKFKMLWDPADADMLAIQAAHLTRAAIDMVALDGPKATSGSQGPRATWLVKTFPRAEHLTDGMEVDVELVPMQTGNAPYWAYVGASTYGAAIS